MRITFKPLTKNQEGAVEAFRSGKHLLLDGYPRTGKTFLALYLALKEVEDRRKGKVIILRSAVPSRELGYLPGSLAEKLAVYETPYISIVSKLYKSDYEYGQLKRNGELIFASTSYLRGNDLEDCVVIIDEFQNMNFQEIHTIITRMYGRVRIVVCGDIYQCDLRSAQESGYNRAATAFRKMPSFASISFTEEDIVGNEVIKEWFRAIK